MRVASCQMFSCEVLDVSDGFGGGDDFDVIGEAPSDQ